MPTCSVETKQEKRRQKKGICVRYCEKIVKNNVDSCAVIPPSNTHLEQINKREMSVNNKDRGQRLCLCVSKEQFIYLSGVRHEMKIDLSTPTYRPLFSLDIFHMIICLNFVQKYRLLLRFGQCIN